MSFSSLSINQSRNVNDLSKYVIGATINKQEEPSGIVSGAALMGGISGSVWALKNRKDLKGGFQQLAKESQAQKALVNSTSNKLAGATEVTSKAELERLAEKAGKINKKTGLPKNEQLYKDIQAALKKGKNYTSNLKTIEQKQAFEALKAYNAKVATQMANGSTLRTIKNATGITKLSRATKELAAKSGKFRTLLKGVKGNAGFAAISLGIGVLSDVVPTFTQLGAEKGFKQLGKTVAKTGFEVAGWAAGAAAGAKLGAVVGSFCGPAGTVVGGAIGLLGGFVGSFVASKLGDKIVGPSEIELAEEKTAKQIAKVANSNKEGLDELALASYEQLVQRAAEGTLTENDMEAKKALENLLGCEINLEEEVKALQGTSSTEDTANLASATQITETTPNTNTNQTSETAETETKKETEPKEEEEEKQTSTAYNNTTFMPNYTQMYNPMNLYNQMNPYYAMNSNPYMNDMYYQKMFPNSTQYNFRYSG